MLCASTPTRESAAAARNGADDDGASAMPPSRPTRGTKGGTFSSGLNGFCATRRPMSGATSSVSTAPATLPAGSGFFACFRRSSGQHPASETGKAVDTSPPAGTEAAAATAVLLVPAADSPNAPKAATVSARPHYFTLVTELIMWERELRAQLQRHEREELVQMVWGVEGTLLPVMAGLRDVNALGVEQEEAVQRWCLYDKYFAFLLDAAALQEVLHRRAMSFAEEPRARKRIVDAEVPHWIEARRLQVMRETQESAATENEERARRLAYFVHVQQQLYQVFLLEEGERADRMEVERLQRLYAGGFAEVMAKEYRHARLCQLRYEAMRRALRPEVARDLIADEARHRSQLCQEQALGFRKLQADEIRGYLASGRQAIRNQQVEEG